MRMNISVVVAVVAGLAAGALMGALLIHSRLAPAVAAITGRAEILEAEKAQAQARVDALEKQAEGLSRQLAALKAEPLAAAQQPEAQADGEAPVEAEQEEFDVTETPGREARRRPSEPDQAADETAADGDDQRWTPEERAARFREFEQRARERVGEVLQQEYASASDSATKERIEVLNEYVEHMAQLREAMRDAQTDQERDELRQTMRESFDNMRQIVQSQQDSMLRNLAATSGITDPAKQDAFVAGLRELQGSPFFQADRMMGGGGPPMGFGWGGDRGDRGDRGGRGPWRQ